ncbi:MAG: DUF2254 family protein [Albidovulum sp.]
MIWRTPFNALMTVPATIAIGIGLLALPTIWLESWLGTPDWLEALDTGAVRVLLSVVAGGAMTALTLTFSLTLVVFTLAASSIGPRLLKRFTTDRVNQVTSGILGGTFLYALVGIVFSGAQPSRFAALGAGLLAVTSVVQLIWFVRSVAQSVSVDDEIAQITVRLRGELARLNSNQSPSDDLPPDADFRPVVHAQSAGYIAEVKRQVLCSLADANDIVIRIEYVAGHYLLEGAVIASVAGEVDEETTARLAELITQEPARSDAGNVHFSVNLLVEIALRALSPGINDTFTALAVADLLSGALAEIADGAVRPEVITGAGDKARLLLPGVALRPIFGQAFHPLRRAAANNVLMAQGLARAYARLFEIGGTETRDVMADHARLLMADLARAAHLEADLNSVGELFPAEMRRLADI